jgi:hypothetical protein
MYYFDCTEGRTGPILDLAVAGISLASAVSVASDGNDDPWADGVALVHGLQAALYAASGYIGFKKTSRCREARRLLADRLHARGPDDSVPGPGQADPQTAAVHVEPAEISIAVGERIQLTATAVNSAGMALTGRSFLWTSSNVTVASVDKGGLVIGRTEGRAMVAANTGGVVGVAEVVVVRRDYLTSPWLGRMEGWSIPLDPPPFPTLHTLGPRLGMAPYDQPEGGG